MATPKAICLPVLGFLYTCVLGSNPFISKFDFFFFFEKEEKRTSVVIE